MRKRDIKCGHWCRTVWNDGARDGLIVGQGENVPLDELQVYFPDSNQVESVDFDQVIEIGNELQDIVYSESGLSGMAELRKVIA